MSEKPRRGILLGLAVDGVVPVIGGCAGAIAGGPEAGLVGAAVGHAVEKVINFFGGRIVDRWAAWFAAQPPEAREKALAELAAMTPAEAREAAEKLLAPAAGSPADKDVALVYLSLLPGAVDRALTRRPDGRRSVPATVSFDAPNLLSLLPVHLPPYAVGQDVPGTPYRLEGLLGSGGFGAVYRASTRALQHLPLAVKFCLDPAMVPSLHRERGLLERLMKAGGESWSGRVVRLYGYDLDHPTPYLVYEFVTGGDLIRHLGERREALGRALTPDEVLELVRQITEGLAFAHESGLVHRDLKPANVLAEGGVLKLADFGLGGVNAARAALVSRIGASTHGMLDPAEQATLFRGAGTPLYMAPEQRRGLAPDPRHDLYSLGVLWYQLLVGDVTRELHPGWARELAVKFNVPKHHIELIERCVGWLDERPANAGELLPLLRGPAAAAAPAGDLRRELLVSLMKGLTAAYAEAARLEASRWNWVWWTAGAAFALFTTLAEGYKLSPSLATFLSAWPTAGLGVTLFLIHRHRLASAGERAAETVGTLEAEFPEQVAGWGGVAVLNDPATAAALVEQIDPAETPASRLPSLTAEQRAELGGMLREVRAKQKAALSTAQPFGFFPAFLLAVALGVGAGFGAGFLRQAARAPMWVAAASSHYTHDGQALSTTEYAVQSKAQLGDSLGLGLGVGLGVGLAALVLLTRLSWYRWDLGAAAYLAPLIAVPVGFGAAALHRSLYAPSALLGRGNVELVSHEGMKLSQTGYALELRRVEASSALTGVAAGLLAEALLIAGWLAWHHRHARQARLELDAQIAQAAAKYPNVIAPAGGVAALRDRAKVDELLARLG